MLLSSVVLKKLEILLVVCWGNTNRRGIKCLYLWIYSIEAWWCL